MVGHILVYVRSVTHKYAVYTCSDLEATDSCRVIEGLPYQLALCLVSFIGRHSDLFADPYIWVINKYFI